MSDIKCIVKCAKGHKLKYTSSNSLFNSNEDYLGGFNCNHCTESYDQTGSYHCKKCCYDLCSVCYTNRAEGNCAEGHQLKKYKTPDDGYGCDNCEDTFNQNSTLYGCRICNWDLCSKCFSPTAQNKKKKTKTSSSKLKTTDTSMHSKTNNSQGFSNFGALGELLQIIDNHMLFMNAQETNVDEFIDNSGSVDLLRAAKDKALETEKELMQQIMNISEINTFLNNIILIENLFNSFYTADFKQQQQTARDKYATNIAKYETQLKPQCDIGSFVELMFAGTNLHISSFKKWLAKLVTACKQNNVKIIENSGARGKNIERAFYKSFYVYAVTHGDDGFKQMTDVLRCSLVFENFDDLYQCFGLIEELSAQDDNGGILRCKDRFNPVAMPFGYRDMLINIYCPGSKIVAEIQLHHKLFYKRKKISHTMYKKARLFEEEQGNMAYQYADEHIRKVIGDKIYESELKEDEEKLDQVEEEEEEDIFEQYECEMSAEELFEKWKLTKYIESFIDEEGYDEPNLWKDISIEELKSDYGFKAGHAKKFVHHVQELEKGREKFEEIKKKRKKKKKTKKEEVVRVNEVMQEVEVPQKGKMQTMKQQSGSGHVLAQPQKLQKEGDVVPQTQPQPGQAYMTSPQQQSQQQPQQQYVQAQAQAQPQQNQLQQQSQYAAGSVLPPGWSMLVTADGKPYYLNNNTKVTQWERPVNVDVTPPQQVQQVQQQNVVPQYVVPQQQQQAQYVVPHQQNVIPQQQQNQMQPPRQQYNLQAQNTQNQLQPQPSQYSLKPQHSQNQLQAQQNQMQTQQSQYGLQVQPQTSPNNQYGQPQQNQIAQVQGQSQLQPHTQQQYNPVSIQQQQYRQNPVPNNQYVPPQQQPPQTQPQPRQHSPPQNAQYNQQLQRQNSPPQQKLQNQKQQQQAAYGVSPRSISNQQLQQQNAQYINAPPLQQPLQQPPQTHLQHYGSGSGQYQQSQTNEQLQQTLQQQEQQKLLLLQQQQQQQQQHQQLLQQQQQQALLQQQQMGGMGVLGGGGVGGVGVGGGNMGGMMPGMGMMGGMRSGMMNSNTVNPMQNSMNSNVNVNTSMNSVNSVNVMQNSMSTGNTVTNNNVNNNANTSRNSLNAMQNNMNTGNSMTNMSSDFGMDADMGNDTDTFHENLATEIAQDDDKNFNTAYNSLYGNQQQQQQQQKQKQPKQQQQTSSPFGYDNMAMGGFGNM